MNTLSLFIASLTLAGGVGAWIAWKMAASRRSREARSDLEQSRRNAVHAIELKQRAIDELEAVDKGNTEEAARLRVSIVRHMDDVQNIDRRLGEISETYPRRR